MDEIFLNGRVILKPGDCRDGIKSIPDNSIDAIVTDVTRRRPGTIPSRALEVGKAAEHLVCCDLIMSGYRAFLSDQGLPYDVMVDHGGRIIKVQVKSTVTTRSVPDRPNITPSYFFHVRRSGKGAKRKIAQGEFDILALVALDIMKIAYVRFSHTVKQSIILRPPGTPITRMRSVWKNIDEMPFDAAINGAYR